MVDVMMMMVPSDDNNPSGVEASFKESSSTSCYELARTYFRLLSRKSTRHFCKCNDFEAFLRNKQAAEGVQIPNAIDQVSRVVGMRHANSNRSIAFYFLMRKEINEFCSQVHARARTHTHMRAPCTHARTRTHRNTTSGEKYGSSKWSNVFMER